MELTLPKRALESEDGPFCCRENQLVTLQFIEADSIRMLTARIRSVRSLDGEQIAIEFDGPLDIATHQRRSYFRLDTHDFKKKLADSEAQRVRVLDVGVTIKAFHRLGESDCPFKTELVNISAGGLLCLFTDDTPPLNSLLHVRLLIPEKGVVECLGRVARIEKSERTPNRWLIGVTFLEIREADREKILDYTYGVQQLIAQTENF